jgi:hypothetical protein
MNAKLADQQTGSEGVSEQELLEEFVRHLEGASSFSVAPERHYEVEFPALDGRQRLDALLRVDGNHDVWLAIEMKREAFPRDIKNALWQLDEYQRAVQGEKDVIPVVLAHNLSPGARELLRSRNVAYYDASGSLFLRRGEVVIDIDRPAAPAPRSRSGSLFAGAREQVIHALLNARGEWITGKELAEQAKTSSFTVSQTLSELERMEWVKTDGGGRTALRRLEQPGALLDAWAAAWKERAEARSRWFAFSANPRVLPDSIAEKLHAADEAHWCISGAVAGNALAPLLTSVDVVDLIVAPGRARSVAAAAGAKPAEKGANLVIVERSGASDLFRRSMPDHPAPLASPFIVYLDLLKDARGRNQELASQLRSTVLKV